MTWVFHVQAVHAHAGEQTISGDVVWGDTHEDLDPCFVACVFHGADGITKQIRLCGSILAQSQYAMVYQYEGPEIRAADLDDESVVTDAPREEAIRLLRDYQDKRRRGQLPPPPPLSPFMQRLVERHRRWEQRNSPG